MIVIYGTKKIKRVKGQAREYRHCDNCGKDAQWQLINLWTWFTLYYIPLFPVWRQKIFSCPLCGCGIKVNKDNQDVVMAALGYTNQQAITQSVQQGSSMPQQTQAANPYINNIQPVQQGSSMPQQTQAANPYINNIQPVQQGSSMPQQTQAANPYINNRQPVQQWSSMPQQTQAANPYINNRQLVQQGSSMPQRTQAANPYINNRQQGSSQDRMVNTRKVRVCPECHLMFVEGQVTCNVCGGPLKDK